MPWPAMRSVMVDVKLPSLDLVVKELWAQFANRDWFCYPLFKTGSQVSEGHPFVINNAFQNGAYQTIHRVAQSSSWNAHIE
jgi:hypothetical protein